MFKFPNLKLYRKFLILAVLLGGLCFTLTAGRKASAECGFPYQPCCVDCQIAHTACQNDCYYYFPPGEKRNQCIIDCLDYWHAECFTCCSYNC